jgi:hypothetical protein
MLMPYSESAASMVRFWCVTMIGWELSSSRRSAAAAAGSVVKRGLDLVRTRTARPGSEDRDEEGDRGQRPLAAGSSDSRLIFLPGGLASKSMPVLSVVGLGQHQPPSPPGNSVLKICANSLAVSS